MIYLFSQFSVLGQSRPTSLGGYLDDGRRCRGNTGGRKVAPVHDIVNHAVLMHSPYPQMKFLIIAAVIPD
jgi:hypothetical protein